MRGVAPDAGGAAESATSVGNPNINVAANCDCKAETRRKVVCMCGGLTVAVAAEPEYGYRVVVERDGTKTTVRAERLGTIKVLAALEKEGVQDPESLVRRVEDLFREAKRRARASCRVVSAAPLAVTCQVEGESFTLKRVGGEWYLVEPYVKRIGELSLSAVAEVAERFLVSAEQLYNTLAEEVGEVHPEAWRVEYFHPAHDYVGGLGPVLGVRYSCGDRECFGYVYVRGGRPELSDIYAPVKDEDAKIVYRPSILDPPDAARAQVHLPDFVDVVEAYREAPAFTDVAREVEAHIRSRMTASDTDIKFAAVFVAASYFFPIARYHPALVLGKPGFGTGGTTAAKVLASLMPRPAFRVDPTWASLFRIAHVFRPTSVIDEIILELGEEALQKIRLYLIARYDRDIAVSRADEGGARIASFKVFSNAVVVDPQGLVANLATVRRSPRITLYPDPSRREIVSVEDEVRRPEVRRLTARLYALFLRHAADLKAEYDRAAEIFPCHGAVLQAFALLLVARRMGKEYLDAVAAKIREWIDEMGVMHTIGDPTKQVLAKVLEDIEHLEEYVRARSSPETGWLAPESAGGGDPPRPWRIDVVDGRVEVWTYLEFWRKYLQRALGELRQVSRKKETGEEVEWVETRVKDLGPALSRTAFASLLRPHLSHVMRRDKRRNLKVVFTSPEDIVKARESLRKALPEGNLGPCPPEPNAEEGRRVQGAQPPSAEPVQSECTACASSCAGGGCSPGGGVEGTVLSTGGAAEGQVERPPQQSGEEAAAWEELERFIQEHLPRAEAAEKQSRGGAEKKAKEEILREFMELVKKYSEGRL